MFLLRWKGILELRHLGTRKHTALRCDSDSVPKEAYPETQELRKLKTLRKSPQQRPCSSQGRVSPGELRSSGPHSVARLAVLSSLLLFFSASSSESHSRQ